MTIRFTKSWNGYYEGQIVSNPAGGNTEAQLIALGYAVSDLDGPDNSFELAKFATDSSNNVTGLVGQGGKPVIQGDTYDRGAGMGRFTTTINPAISAGLINTYRTAIATATDTVSAFELDAIKWPLARLMRSSIFAKLRVLWIPLGTDATKGALVPLIGSNFSAINLVLGDYSAYSGVTGNGTNKAINTNWNPNSVASSWGAGAFVTSLTASGVVFGTVANNNTFCALAAGGANINNVNVGTQKQYPGFLAINHDGASGGSYLGGFEQTSAAIASATAPNSNITLLSTNSSFYSTQSISGFAAWAPSATADEIKELTMFFRNANLALGRLACQPSIVADGDSITYGFGLGSPTTSRYSKLLSTALGLTEDNQGSNGSAMSPAGGAVASWLIDYKILRSAGRAPTLLIVALGTNDDQTDVPVTTFEADYRTWMGYQFAAGIDPGQIVMIAPFAATNAAATLSVLAAMRDVVKKLAIEFGAIFVDGYALTLGQSSYFQADNLHLNEAGHSALTTEILRVLATSKSDGPLYRAAYQP